MVMEGRDGNETNLPATHDPAPARAWLPEPNVDSRRPPRAESSPGQGPQAPDRGLERSVANRSLGRLRKGPEFDVVYREGTVVNGPLFVLRMRTNEVGHERWGFAVGKKLAPRAVDRNALRRRLREAARSFASNAEQVRPLSGGVDIIVTARAPLAGANYNQIRLELARQFERATSATNL